MPQRKFVLQLTRRRAGGDIEREGRTILACHREPGVIFAEREPRHVASARDWQLARLQRRQVDQEHLTVGISERQQRTIIAFGPRGQSFVRRKAQRGRR